MLLCALPALYRRGGAALRLYGGDGTVLATVDARAGFTLGYLHSINLSPVDEDFSIGGDGMLTLWRLRFGQLSTGMPSGDEDGFALEGERFVTRPNRAYRSIQLRVSPVPGHELRLTDGKAFPLTRWAPPGGLIVLEAAPRYKD